MPSTSIGIYNDAAMTSLFTVLPAVMVETTVVQKFIGSALPDIVYKRFTLPDVNQLIFAAVDNDTGDAVELTNFKFALSEAGLASATPGAALPLGTSIDSGAGNGLPIWIAFTDTAEVIDLYPGGISFVVLDVWDYPA
jgi:hypothetical protein